MNLNFWFGGVRSFDMDRGGGIYDVEKLLYRVHEIMDTVCQAHFNVTITHPPPLGVDIGGAEPP